MALLIIAPGERPEWWRRELHKLMPGLDIRIWPDTGDVAQIDYALAWKPPHGALAKLPALRCIFSMGAGVDHIFEDPACPDVAVARVVDPYLTAGMREYVLLHVLRYHKNQPAFDDQQRNRVWDDRAYELVQADERTIGVMGLGVLGQAAATALAALEFDVAGWSRTAKTIPGVTCFHGADGLAPFLARTQILVCLLPLTVATEGILNAATLAQLPRGACLINAARGGHLVEEDLIPALDSGQLAHATLDVFRTEPLPEAHPFWSDARITVTPHNASITDPRSVVRQVVENIRRGTAGEAYINLVDPAIGY